jgi:hypothetical protein
MDEHEVHCADDAAFFLANDVILEYHGFPIVQRADIGGANVVFILINEDWYRLDVSAVTDDDLIIRLEALAG